MAAKTRRVRAVRIGGNARENSSPVRVETEAAAGGGRGGGEPRSSIPKERDREEAAAGGGRLDAPLDLAHRVEAAGWWRPALTTRTATSRP